MAPIVSASLRPVLLPALAIMSAVTIACGGAATEASSGVSQKGASETNDARVTAPDQSGERPEKPSEARKGIEAKRPADEPRENRSFAPLASLNGQYPEYEDKASGLRSILGTPDLGVGTERVSFVLSNQRGIIKIPIAKVETYFYPEGADGPREGPVETENARYDSFPLGVRGIYVTHLTFDRPGLWAIKASVPTPDGSRTGMQFSFRVNEAPQSVQVGQEVPDTDNRTLRDVASVAELTTSSEPDPKLYAERIPELKAAGRPFVVTFASPAFCTNALCGPQVEVLSHVRERYEDRASFVHIDLYENPHEIQGDLSKAVRTPILEDWGLESDEWTFIVDEHGRVASKFEAFVTEEELETALLETLRS